MGDPHVRFDERDVETGLRPGYVGTVSRKGRQQTSQTYCYRATSRLYRLRYLRVCFRKVNDRPQADVHERRLLDFPRYRGHAGASRRSPFKGLGADAAEVTVAAGSIVEHLDVVEDVGAGELARFVDSLAYALFLQGAEEGFGDRIDAPMSNWANERYLPGRPKSVDR